MTETKQALRGRHVVRWMLRGLAGIGLSALVLAPLRAQEANSGGVGQLHFGQFYSQAWPSLSGQVHRAYPFGVYRADNLNSSGPDYNGWSHLPPSQPWRGGGTNSPSRKRYGLDSDSQGKEILAGE